MPCTTTWTASACSRSSVRRDHGPIRATRVRLHQRGNLSESGRRREVREDAPGGRARGGFEGGGGGAVRGRFEDGGETQQGRLLLAVRAWADDGRLPGERLVLRRQGVGPPRD